MDLNRIIGRRKYRVRLPPSEVFEEIEKFLCPREIVSGCKEWWVHKGTKFRRFIKDARWDFIVGRAKIPWTAEELQKLQNEFRENFSKYSRDFIEELRHNAPYELRVLISDVDELGCVCQAECRPALYEKLSKEVITIDTVSDFHIEDSHSESLSFLDQVFIGALEAKPILEVPVKSPELELIVNNTQQREITDLIDSLLNKATGEVLICGWIGTHFIPKLRELANEGVKIRFITHQPSEAKNQPWRSEINQAFEKLCSHIGKENICTDPNMHGRMIIVDNKALIGSMDLNAYSLTGAHTEFAIYTERPEIVRRLRNIFNSKFKPLKAG